MANSSKSKVKATKPNSEKKEVLENKVIKKVNKVEAKAKVVHHKKPVAKTPEDLKVTKSTLDTKNVVADKKVEIVSDKNKLDSTKAKIEAKTDKKSFLEPGLKSVSFIALMVVVLFAVIILIWEFALPTQYKISTIVSDSKVDRIFLQAEKLKADDNYDVAVIESCNLAIRFDKNKYTPNFAVTKNGNFGVYKDPFNKIFDNKDLSVYEFSLTEKQATDPNTKPNPKPKAAVVACLDADLKRNLVADDLKEITDTLSAKIPTSFTKVSSELKEIPFFNETSQKYFGTKLFQKIRLTSEQAPDLDINNTFFAFDNRLLFVASQNTPDNIEFQVNSINPSDSSFDTKTILDKFKEETKDFQERINNENSKLNFEKNKDWEMNLDIANIGSLDLQLSDNYGPKSVENFVRLTYRGYYNDTIFHRIVKKDNFNVLQGGDKENRNGTGGRSSFYLNETSPGNIPDEVWKVAPEFTTDQTGQNTPTNTPEFRAPELYKDYDNKTGLVTFPKGSIAMATTGQPDSGSSQFFIILSDTQLPAEYTIFGKVKESSFDVLDKILNEISPTKNADVKTASGEDGVPNKELKINSIKITNPQI